MKEKCRICQKEWSTVSTMVHLEYVNKLQAENDRLKKRLIYTTEWIRHNLNSAEANQLIKINEQAMQVERD